MKLLCVTRIPRNRSLGSSSCHQANCRLWLPSGRLRWSSLMVVCKWISLIMSCQLRRMCQHSMLNLKFSQICFNTCKMFNFLFAVTELERWTILWFSWKTECQNASFIEIFPRFYLDWRRKAIGLLSTEWRVKHYLHFIATFRNYKTTRWSKICVNREREKVVFEIKRNKNGSRVDKLMKLKDC